MSATEPNDLNSASRAHCAAGGGSAKRREDVRTTYRRWWLGKMVRQQIENTAPFRLVTGVEWHGPPSGVYGCVELFFADGTRRMVSTMSYRPRKSDIEVLPNNSAQP